MNLNTQSKTRQVWTDETQSGAGPETLVYRSADHERRRLVVFVGTLLFLLLLVRTAWTSDDAYITFRTIDNFLHGFGLRWNVANRVQAYTHPLWMWTIAAAVALTREYYYTSIVISMAVSGLTVALLAGRLAASVPMALLALSCVLLSQAFVDYSTSSLENPLFHLLLVAVLIVDNSRLAPPRPLLVLTLLASLLMLTRLDTGLLVLPLLIVRAKEQPFTRAFRTVAIGLLPLVAWEAFSLVYYGSLFPNTAYSKLRTGVAESELAYQGFLYLLDAMHRDVLTVLVLATGTAWAWGTKPLKPLALGLTLYLAYVVWVGGDFMAGRFLTAPFVLAVGCFAQRTVFKEFDRSWVVAMVLIWIAGLAAPPPIVASNDYCCVGTPMTEGVGPADSTTSTGITDERRFYYMQSGLLSASRGFSMPNHKWIRMGEELASSGAKLFKTDAAGFIGFAAGPTVYLIDKYGLGDPLLARLPARAPWRIGHFARDVPEGYEETILTGANQIRDLGVAAYYSQLKIITEDPIWSVRRFRAIVRMNLGHFEPYLASYAVVRINLERLDAPRANGTTWNDDENTDMTSRGLEITAAAPIRGACVEVSVSRNDRYRFAFRDHERDMYDYTLEPVPISEGSLLTHRFPIPSDRAFDSVRVLPSEGDGQYSLGHFRIVTDRQCR